VKAPPVPESRRDGEPGNILALDTASATLSAALSAGEEIWYFEADAGLRHSELLMEIVDALFGKAGMDRADLGAVACMKGPGSFTGLRIGFAAAKGIALALGIPLLTAPALDCMAAPLSFWPGIVLPAIDAKKNSFFAALYSGGSRLCPDMDAEASAIARALGRERGAGLRDPGPAAGKPCPVILTGPGAGLLASRLEALPGGEAAPEFRVDPLCRRGRAGELLKLAKDAFLINNEGETVFSGPEYIRPSDAELKSGPGTRTPAGASGFPVFE
jgi:tRNA threonylcarbamoyladenosine biosynthesis protein TsaB